MRPICAALITLIVLSSTAATTSAQEAVPRFCVTPITNGAPTAADHFQTWRLTSNSFNIPGLGTIFTPTNRKGQWTIDAKRRLVPYTGLFPMSYLDRENWLVEPWSNRILAIGRRRLLELDRRAGEFVRFGGDKTNAQSEEFYALIQIPRLRTTIAVGQSGMPYLIGKAALTPLLSPAERAANQVNQITYVFDAPSLAGLLLLDDERKLHLRTDSGDWYTVRNGRSTLFARVFEPKNAEAVILSSRKSVVAVRKQRTNSGDTFAATTLARTRANGADKQFIASEFYSDLLTYGRGGWFDWRNRWRRLTKEGFEAIPGDNQIEPKGRVGFYTLELTSINKMLIKSESGLLLYDGKRIAVVPGSGPEQIGQTPFIQDLPSIGRTLISSVKGLWELTGSGALVRRALPIQSFRFPGPEFWDWPQSEGAVVSHAGGMFFIDRSLNATTITSEDVIGHEALPRVVNTNLNGEMVISAGRDLFTLNDTLRTGRRCQ